MWRQTVILALFAFTLSPSDGSAVLRNNCLNIPKDQWFAYDKSKLLDTNAEVTNLARSNGTGNLYFITDDNLYVLTTASTDSRKILDNISQVEVDETTNTVFVWSDDKLDIYNEETGSFETVTKVTHVRTFPWKNHTTVRIPDLIEYGMRVDSDNNIFFLTVDDFPAVLLEGNEDETKYEDVFSEKVLGVGIGFKNRGLAATSKSLYYLPTDSVTPILIATLDFPWEDLVIDDDGNIFVGTDNAIVKLTYKYPDCVKDILGGE